MAKPYSYDFRQKVLQAIELDGLKKCEVSQLFNISRNTINLWLQRKAETGDVQALPNRPPGNNHLHYRLEKFRANALTHGDKTQVEMAQLWEGDISDSEIAQSHEL
jgi:transposase